MDRKHVLMVTSEYLDAAMLGTIMVAALWLRN